MPTPARKSDPRFQDFDAAVDEATPIPIRLLGKDWLLPGTVPAETILRVQKLMLLAQRLEAEGDEALPDDFVIDDSLSIESMARQLVGDKHVDQWLKLGISYEKLTAVTQHVFAIHTGGEPEGKGPKKPQDRKPPVKRAAGASPRKRSSSTGR